MLDQAERLSLIRSTTLQTYTDRSAAVQSAIKHTLVAKGATASQCMHGLPGALHRGDTRSRGLWFWCLLPLPYRGWTSLDVPGWLGRRPDARDVHGWRGAIRSMESSRGSPLHHQEYTGIHFHYACSGSSYSSSDTQKKRPTCHRVQHDWLQRHAREFKFEADKPWPLFARGPFVCASSLNYIVILGDFRWRRSLRLSCPGLASSDGSGMATGYARTKYSAGLRLPALAIYAWFLRDLRAVLETNWYHAGRKYCHSNDSSFSNVWHYHTLPWRSSQGSGACLSQRAYLWSQKSLSDPQHLSISASAYSGQWDASPPSSLYACMLLRI